MIENEGGNFINIVRVVTLLVPTPFLFHYIETSFESGSEFAFLGLFSFVIFTGIISSKSKLYLILMMNVLAVLLSFILAREFIIPPNSSWFKPFGMDVAIVLTDFVILVGILMLRFIARTTKG